MVHQLTPQATLKKPHRHYRRSGWRRLAVSAAGLAAAVAVAGMPALTGTAEAAASLRELAEARGFKIGTALSDQALRSDNQYGQVAAREFNAITPENAMKWGPTEPSRGQFDFSRADRVAQFAASNDQELRGHALLWHTQLPSWVDGLSASELRQATQNHITTVVNRYEEQIVGWDVVNEPFLSSGQRRQTVWQQKLGDGYIADALRWANQADPNAKLFLNDYGIEGINAKSDAMYNLVRSLKQQGVPIDGVGFESHLTVGNVPGSLEQNIRRFAQLGVEVRITELDVRIPLPASQQELQQQAEDYRQVMNACLSVSGCTGVTVWGFTDKHSWIPDWSNGEEGAATPFDENYQPKPAYNAIAQTLGGGTDPTDPPGQPSGECTVDYAVRNEWNSGFTANLTITNHGGPTSGWSVEFDFAGDQRIVNGWNGDFSQSGSHVTVTSSQWNGSLGTGDSVSVGFHGSHSGSNPEPQSFTMNGVACSTA